MTVTSFFLVRRRALAVLALTLAVPACGPTAPPGDGGVDAGGVDAPFSRPDGSIPCTTDAECDDEVSCTNDTCNPLGFCESRTNAGLCDDSVFCNGIEICHPTRGCLPGPRESCDDSDVCTIDRCNEAEGACEHTARDLDDDGDIDFFCPGGGDCDDRDRLRSSLVPEICMDMVDNDCDDTVDEPECGRAPYDVCTPTSSTEVPPLDVSAGGTFVLSTLGAVNDYMLSCYSTRDVVATFTIPAGSGPRDVDISAQGDSFSVGVGLRSVCDDASSELECRVGFPTRVRRRSLPEGTYYIILTGGFSAPSNITLNVELRDPTPPASNESCTAPIDIPAGGGTVMGSLVDARDDLTAGCSFGGQLDLVYRFTVPSDGPHDVRIALSAESGEYMSFSVRTTCDLSSTDLQCANGGPANARLHELAPGDYFIVVEGQASTEPDFSLVVEILPPTPRLPGDTCADPIPLELGTPFVGTLGGMEHDLDVSCGYYYREAVHEITLTEDSDLAITVDGSPAYLAVSLRYATCSSSAAQRTCRNGQTASLRIHGATAGTYYVIVESPNPGPYTITATATAPPVLATPVTGNDLCGSAVVIPETGGYYTGDTTLFLDDTRMPSTCFGSPASGHDVAFRLDLTRSQHVFASTEGSVFDTVLVVYRGFCMATGGDLYCADDSPGLGVQSSIDRVFDPGTYYFVVDGFGTGSQGTYFLEVVVTDP